MRCPSASGRRRAGPAAEISLAGSPGCSCRGRWGGVHSSSLLSWRPWHLSLHFLFFLVLSALPRRSLRRMRAKFVCGRVTFRLYLLSSSIAARCIRSSLFGRSIRRSRKIHTDIPFTPSQQICFSLRPSNKFLCIYLQVPWGYYALRHICMWLAPEGNRGEARARADRTNRTA